MKLLTVLIGFSTLSINIILGQNRDTSVYKFTGQILTNLDLDSTEWRWQTAAYNFSFSGQYRKALLNWDTDAGTDKYISPADSQHFVQKYHLTDAKDFILEKAKASQIIIFNEAHYNPRNRVFVSSLLPDLKAAGYSYFAAETLSSNTQLSGNMIPTFNTGYYTSEPAFGNLIREVTHLNYTLIPYETTTIVAPREREINQAQNLAVFLKAHPSAKIIVYCGFSHILEDSLPTWGKAMAGRLREFTGINPYTIDQVELSEHSKISFESPFYRLLSSENYGILVDSENAPFRKRGIDALLYSPRTKDIHNRPGWVFENGRTAYFIHPGDIKLQFPIIFQAYLSTDNIKTVIPVDVIEIEKPADLPKTALSLPLNEPVIIVAHDRYGNSQTIAVANNPR